MSNKKLSQHLTFIGLCIVLSCGLFSKSIAQRGEISIGIQLNPALSWFNTDKARVEPNGTNLGFQMGGLFEYGLNDNIFLVTGFRFDIGMGGNLVFEQGGDFWPQSDLFPESLHALNAGSELKYNIQFVEIPFGLIWRTNPFGTGAWRAYVEPPTPTLLLSTRARGTVVNLVEDEQDILDDVRTLNFGLGFGGGITYSAAEGFDVQFGLAYTRSFSDSLNDGTWDDGEKEDSKAKLGILSFKVMGLF